MMLGRTTRKSEAIVLKFYYNPISANARRVWIALLEKAIPFEPVLVQLDGDQFAAEFTAVNPLQRVPVLVDGDLRVVESLAILDYLEAKYPQPALLPDDPAAIARVRMVASLVVVELQPATLPLMRQLVELPVEPAKLAAASDRVATILQFLADLLADRPYFAGETFTLAEVVAGSLLPSLPLADYPNLVAWAERLAQRPSWQQTAAGSEAIAAALPNIRQIIERRS